jgi:hypothetical protein
MRMSNSIPGSLPTRLQPTQARRMHSTIKKDERFSRVYDLFETPVEKHLFSSLRKRVWKRTERNLRCHSGLLPVGESIGLFH